MAKQLRVTLDQTLTQITKRVDENNDENNDPIQNQELENIQREINCIQVESFDDSTVLCEFQNKFEQLSVYPPQIIHIKNSASFTQIEAVIREISNSRFHILIICVDTHLFSKYTAEILSAKQVIIFAFKPVWIGKAFDFLLDSGVLIEPITHEQIDFDRLIEEIQSQKQNDTGNVHHLKSGVVPLLQSRPVISTISNNQELYHTTSILRHNTLENALPNMPNDVNPVNVVDDNDLRVLLPSVATNNAEPCRSQKLSKHTKSFQRDARAIKFLSQIHDISYRTGRRIKEHRLVETIPDDVNNATDYDIRYTVLGSVLLMVPYDDMFHMFDEYSLDLASVSFSLSIN
nr:non-structural protein [Fako virus]AIW39881.1 non-structural protein [Fako virus]